MVFLEYKKLLKSIGELQKPICTLEKSQRIELLELSARQEYYEKDIEDSVRLTISELKQSLEGLKNWLDDFNLSVDQAFGPEGTPKKIVALEETFNNTRLMKEQILSLVGPKLEVAAAMAAAKPEPLLLPPGPIRLDEESDVLLPVKKVKNKRAKKNKLR